LAHASCHRFGNHLRRIGGILTAETLRRREFKCSFWWDFEHWWLKKRPPLIHRLKKGKAQGAMSIGQEIALVVKKETATDLKTPSAFPGILSCFEELSR
jgi:hypothetical protein